jgi:hypothetical protein
MMEQLAAPPEAPKPATPPLAAMPEPATSRALWPTFMRRTLSEDLLRQPPRKADA